MEALIMLTGAALFFIGVCAGVFANRYMPYKTAQGEEPADKYAKFRNPDGLLSPSKKAKETK